MSKQPGRRGPKHQFSLVQHAIQAVIGEDDRVAAVRFHCEVTALCPVLSADVLESPLANSVTSWPSRTSSSVW
jgi:hypothetical protein